MYRIQLEWYRLGQISFLILWSNEKIPTKGVVMLHPTFPLSFSLLLEFYFIQNLCAGTRKHTILSFYSRQEEVASISDYS